MEIIMDNLLKEAIADAKAVRETALANAKLALEEAFTPRLKSMLAKKIQDDLQAETDEVEEVEERMDDEDKEDDMEERMKMSRHGDEHDDDEDMEERMKDMSRHGDEMDEEHCEGEVQALLGSFHHHNQCHSPGLHSPVSCTRTPTPTGMRDRKTHPHAAAAHVHSVAAQPDADVKSTASAWNIVATVPPATWLPRISLHSHSHPAKLA